MVLGLVQISTHTVTLYLSLKIKGLTLFYFYFAVVCLSKILYFSVFFLIKNQHQFPAFVLYMDCAYILIACLFVLAVLLGWTQKSKVQTFSTLLAKVS